MKEPIIKVREHTVKYGLIFWFILGAIYIVIFGMLGGFEDDFGRTVSSVLGLVYVAVGIYCTFEPYFFKLDIYENGKMEYCSRTFQRKSFHFHDIDHVERKLFVSKYEKTEYLLFWDKNGRKLARIEENMPGYKETFRWIKQNERQVLDFIENPELDEKFRRWYTGKGVMDKQKDTNTQKIKNAKIVINTLAWGVFPLLFLAQDNFVATNWIFLWYPIILFVVYLYYHSFMAAEIPGQISGEKKEQWKQEHVMFPFFRLAFFGMYAVNYSDEIIQIKGDFLSFFLTVFIILVTIYFFGCRKDAWNNHLIMVFFLVLYSLSFVQSINMVFPADEEEVVVYGYMVDRIVEKEGNDLYYSFVVVMDEDDKKQYRVPVSKELFDWYGLYGGVKMITKETRFGFQYGLEVVK